MILSRPAPGWSTEPSRNRKSRRWIAAARQRNITPQAEIPSVFPSFSSAVNHVAWTDSGVGAVDVEPSLLRHRWRGEGDGNERRGVASVTPRRLRVVGEGALPAP
jgi:hypothetical protein